MSPLTTHVLDTAKGCPARNIVVTVERSVKADEWQKLSQGVTNDDGRVADLLKKEQFTAGVYRLTFDTAAYHGAQGFFPYVSIIFTVKNPAQHHHVPILLSPFGYSTYRGS